MLLQAARLETGCPPRVRFVLERQRGEPATLATPSLGSANEVAPSKGGGGWENGDWVSAGRCLVSELGCGGSATNDNVRVRRNLEFRFSGRRCITAPDTTISGPARMSHFRADSGPVPGDGGGGGRGPTPHTRSISSASLRSGHSSHPAATFKLLVLGDSAVGKSCIINRAVHGDAFQHPSTHTSTVGVDMQKKELYVGDKLVKLQIWDTAGQERFRSIAANYYRGAHGVIVCYDVTRKDSFRNVKQWLQSIAEATTGDCELVLVANKIDLVGAGDDRDEDGRDGDDEDAADGGRRRRREGTGRRGSAVKVRLLRPFYLSLATIALPVLDDRWWFRRRQVWRPAAH